MENHFEIQMTEDQLRGISSIGLAHLGDAVFELLVRGWLCQHGKATGKGLHQATIQLVRAEHQAACAEKILPMLTEEELAVFRRGRNAQVHSIPSHASRAQYSTATALEALFGWLYLGGQRQRYERFGYVPAGAHWEFTLTPRNVRDIRTGGVALAPLAEYPSWLESARALHEKQPVTCARGGDASFLTVLQSWRAEPYAVLQDGMFAGYCALAEGKPPRLQELVLPDAALLPAFAAALAQHTGAAGVRVQLYPWQRAELAYFASVAEQGVCVPNHSYRVFHWAAAARAAMALQRTYDDTAILDEFILEVENEGRLRFGPGAEGVRPAEPQDAAPDLVLPPLDAARLLFGPDSPLVPGAQAVPAGLLPLPLAFPWADGI